MSTTVDERVLEMRFDNKQFEANVQTSMSTLAKLKQSLNLKGASKGLESINTAANKVNFSGMATGIEQVGVRFSHVQATIQHQINNLVDSTIAAGKRMMSALTTDPIKTGFQEYETQINAVQTILANTSHNGTTIEQVNKALDELNKYADKTIYNFTEMTRNIGTFTAAGVDLDTSVNAIQGIANLAAVSGSTSQQASTAMYQLSQALAAGKVSLMDWNSVVNAGMGGKVFQDALVRTSELLGTGAKAAIDTYGSFRESLTQGEWLTTEVLTETLKQFAGSYSEAELIQQGFTEQQAKDIAAMAKTAEDAATKVKTFTQLWDVLKESAQSGWSQTWKLLIGDFEEAKSLLTPLADFMTNVINKMSEARNAVLESALANRFKAIGDTIKTITKPIENSAESIKGVVKSVEEYSKVVDDIIGGKWGSGQERWDKLAEAGYDWAHAQNLVNEKLGSAKRHATDYKEAQNGVADAQKNTAESTGEYIASLVKLTDAELRNKGLTDEQIKALRELEKQSENTGIPIADLVENIDLLNGRTLLINSFKNAGDGLIGTFKALKGAWQSVFPPKSTEERAASLYNFIAAMHKFSLNLRLTDSETGELTDTAKDLMSTFKGVFAIVDIIATIAGGGLRIAFQVLSGILKYFDMDILDLTANIGEAIYQFRNWFKSIFNIDGALEKIIPILIKGADAIKGWGKAFLELPFVQKIIDKIASTFDKLKDIDFSNFGSDVIDTITSLGVAAGHLVKAFIALPQVQKIIAKVKDSFEELKDINFKEIGKNIIDGLNNGLGDGFDSVVQKMKDLGIKILDGICAILGIHSPSLEMFKIGQFIIQGLANGIDFDINTLWDKIKGIGSKLVELFKGIGSKVIDIIKNIDFGQIFAIAVSVGIFKLMNNFVGILEKFTAPIEAVSNVLNSTAGLIDNVSGVVENFGGILKSYATNIKVNALKSIAISIALLVGSIALLTLLDVKKVWASIGALAAIAVIIGVLAAAVGKFGPDKAVSFAGFSGAVLAIAVSLVVMAVALKKLESIDPEKLGTAVKGLAAIVLGLVAVLATFGLLVKGKSAQNIGKLGGMLFKLSLTLLLMVAVIKLMSSLEWSEMSKAAVGIGGFLVVVTSLMLLSKIPGKNVGKVGTTIFMIAGAMLKLVLVAKLIAGMEWGEMGKAAIGLLGFIGIISLLMYSTKLVGNNADKIGKTILQVSAAIVILVFAAKLIAGMEWGEMGKALVGLAGFAGIIALLVLATRLAGSNAPKIALTLIAMAIAIGILAGVAVVLSLIDTKGLAKGIVAVGMLGGVMTAMIWATRGANECKDNIRALMIAVIAMTACIAVLSLIDGKKLAGAVGALVTVMAAFAGLLAVTKIVKNSKKTAKTLWQMLAITVILAAVVAALSFIDSGSALKSAIALSILLVALASSMVLLGKTGRISSTVKPLLQPMILVVLELAGILAALSAVAHFTKDGSMLEATTALSILMSAFAGMMVIMGHTGRISSTVKPLLQPMVLVVLELAVILGALSAVAHFTKDGSMLEAATSLSILLLALSASMVILSHTTPMARTAVGSAALLGLVLAELILVLWMMKELNVSPSIETAAALSILVLALSGACILLGVAGTFGPAAFIGIGVLAALIVGLGAIIIALGALVTEFPRLQEFLDTGIPILEKIGYALGSFFGNIVGGFVSGITSNLPDIATDLSDFMTNLEPFIEGAKKIDASTFDGIKALIDVLGGAGLTSVGLSFAELFTGDTTVMGKLSQSGTEFFSAIKTISDEMAKITLPEDFSVEGITSLLECFKTIGISMAGLSLAEIFTGDSTVMGKFAQSGKDFFAAIKQIVPEMTGFTFPEDFSVEGLTKLLDALKVVGNRMIGLSIADIFAGKDQTAMEKFGVDGVAFFKSIKAISVEMTGFTFPKEFSVEGLTTLLDALKAVGNRVIGLSFADMFAGKDKTAMEKFESDAKAFFAAIKAISAEMTGFALPEGFSKDAITKLFDVLESVSDYTIGASWGDMFTLGGTTMEKFETDGVTFFSTLKSIADKAGSINIENIGIAKNAVSRMKSVIESTSGIDYSGVEEFTGIGTGGFGADGPMHDIGKAITDFSNTVSGIDLAAVKVSVNAATNLKKLITGLVGLDTSGVSLFNPKSIGDKMLSYSNSVSSINIGAVTNSITVANKLKKFISSLSGLDTSGVNSFKTAISSLGKTSFGNIEKTFNANAGKMASIGTKLVDAISKGMQSRQSALINTTNKLLVEMMKVVTSRYAPFANSARNLMTNFVRGIHAAGPMLSKAMSTSLASAISAVSGYYSSFYSAGGHLANGFANGISANSYKAAAKARAMAQAAKQAAEQALGIASPSKVFYKIGDYTGQGFIKALTNYGSKAYSVSSDMANSARDGLTEAISRIADVINGDLDTQPTIRPVLDLSNVEAGVGTLNGLMSNNSIGVVSNLNAINSMMSRRNQNGVNADVVSAINKLDKHLDNVGGNYYNVNGVTYDDGSAIQGAIETIVRAAKIERRS